jgi:hypothetical protein
VHFSVHARNRAMHVPLEPARPARRYQPARHAKLVRSLSHVENLARMPIGCKGLTGGSDAIIIRPMREPERATKNMSGVKVTPSTKAAMVRLWRKEATAQESFGAWVRRKLLTPASVQS